MTQILFFCLEFEPFEICLLLGACNLVHLLRNQTFVAPLRAILFHKSLRLVRDFAQKRWPLQGGTKKGQKRARLFRGHGIKKNNETDPFCRNC